MSPKMRKVWSHARNFAVIATVTLLIWLLAEAESLRVERARTEVVFRADPASGRYIKVDPQFPGFVNIRLEGSTARVDMLASELRQRIRLEPGMEGIPIEPGERVIDLRTVLRNLPAVRETGASIAEVDPPTATVAVDNIVERELPVRVEVPQTVALEGPPEPAPARVRVRMPESLLDDLGPDPQVVAALDAQQLSTLAEGRRAQIKGVPLVLPEALREAEGVTPLTRTANVSVTLRSRNAQAQLSSVPVHVRIAPTETGIWDIQMPAESRILTNVIVHGPSEVIEQIRTEKIRPIAYVPLSFEELESAAASGEPIAKEPIFSELPNALRFEVQPQQKTIRLSVKRRETPPATPGLVTPPNGGTVGNGR